jgi:acyl-coenzyme A synthetase/AMP-(fatty) acid ligase
MADYLPNPLVLSDRIRSLNDGTFELTGRKEDLINIAGKRTSLAGMNHCLLSIDGVQDGAFAFQNTGVEQIERLIALVVAPDKSEEIIMSELRNQLDPVFLPRKIVKLVSIPRTESGKLTKKALSLWLKDLEE